MKVVNYPFTFVGILLLIIGWFAVFSGFFSLGAGSEDTIVIAIKLETMFVNATYIPASHFIWHMVLRIFLGFVIVMIGNSFLNRGLHESHDGICHPRMGDFRRLAVDRRLR